MTFAEIFELNEQIRAIRLAIAEAERTAPGSSTPLQVELNAQIARLEQELTLERVDTSVPLALLPVRLETRYRRLTSGGAELLIRIYPDDIHQDTHEPELTSEEIANAKAFWSAMASAGSHRPGQLEAWRRLAETSDPHRAAWIVRQTKGGAQPTPKAIDRPWARAPHTTVLPDRWVVLGYSTNEGYSARIFEQWGDLMGRNRSDTIQTGPDPTTASAAGGVDEGMRWMVDFEEAVMHGMGIRVLFGPERQPPETIPLLVVLGAKATLGRQESAERLRLLMDAHHYTWGLALVPPGTPTNNTADVASGYAARDPGYEASFSTELGPDLCRPYDGSDGDLLARALGLDPAQPHAFAHIRHADGRHQQDAGSMNDVMWPATWRYFLSEMMGGLDLPMQDRDAVFEAWRQHFVDHVRARGPLPALRVGTQPYGLLPATSIYAWRPRGLQPEVFTLTIDSATQPNQGSLHIGWNADSRTNEFDGWESEPTPGPDGDPNVAAGIAIADLTNSGESALIILRIDRRDSGEYGYLRVGQGLRAGTPELWNAAGPEIPGGTPGGQTQAAGIAVLDLNTDGRSDIVILRVDRRPDQTHHAYLYVGWDLKVDGTVREWSGPVDAFDAFPEPVIAAGLAVADVSGNGLPDVIVMYVTAPGTQNRPWLRIGRDLDPEGRVTGGWTEPVALASFEELGDHRLQGIQITALDLDADGKHDDLVLFYVVHFADKAEGYVRRGHNLTIDGQVSRWSHVGTRLDLPITSGGVGVAMADVGQGSFSTLATRVGRINRLRELLQIWRAARNDVPRIGKSEDPDADLVEVLGLAASSTGVIGRHVLGGTYTDVLWNALDRLDAERWWRNNRDRWSRARNELAQRLFTITDRRIGLLANINWRLLPATYAGDVFRVSGPLVHDGPLSETTGDLTPNYIAWLHDVEPTAIQGGFPHAPVNALLYRILRHATLLEYAYAAFRIAPVAPEIDREPELVDLPDPRQGSAIDPGHVLTYWRHLTEGHRNGQTLAAYLSGLRASGYATPEVAPLGRFLHNLNALSQKPTAVLQRLLTESFDLGSYRLDAWITSVATARMRSVGGFFPAEVLADSPIAYYRLSERAGAMNVVDASGHGHQGTVSSDGISLGAASVGGGDGAALFDGLGSGRITVPDKEVLNPKRITMEALISWSGRNGYQQRILEKSFGPAPLDWKTNYGLSIYEHPNHPELNDTVRVEIWMDQATDVQTLNSTAKITPHTPTHLAATYDGNTIAIYIDGLLNASKAAGGDISSTFRASDLGIGNQVERPRPFNGIIDEVALYDKALSADRIRAHGGPKGSITGIQLGGYGWLENLTLEAPENKRRKNAGFVHAPSLAHAATAAILRSGQLSHQDDADGSLLAIDLSSERARLALDLLDGVREGQSLGALLGYRFERGLHESPGSRTLDRYVSRFRELAPLVACKLTQDPLPSQPLEAIAARNVADGLELLRRWKAGNAITSGPQWTEATIPFDGTVLPLADSSNPEFRAIAAELDLLEHAVDAVSDTLLAESVYQAVQGNPLRAGASVNAISRGDEAPPAELHVLETPRTGIAVSHRILMLFSGDPPANLPYLAAWEPVAHGQARADAEPRVNAWAAQLLGDPAKVCCRVEYVASDGSPIPGTEKRPIFLKELALSPLTVLYASPATDTAQRSDLDQRIALHAWLTRDKTKVPADGRVRLDLSRAEGWGAEVLTFPDLLEVARAARVVVTGARAIDARDTLHPAVRSGAELDVDELDARRKRAVERFAAAKEALERSSGEPTSLHASLLEVAAFDIQGAIPASFADQPSDLEALRDQAKRVAAQVARKWDTIDAAQRAFDATRDASPEARRDHDVAVLQHLFGAGFRVLARFKPPGDLAKALAVRREHRDAGPEIVIPWFQRIARIREGAAQLDTALMYAETIGAGSRLGFEVAQFPLPQPGTTADPWAAGPVPPQGGRLSVTVHAPWPLGELQQPAAGLLIDEWTEVVPGRTETTGVTFHYDAPGACAPQAILLAIPPRPEHPWDLATLEQVVLETWELLKLRAVDPNTLGDVGHFLPPFYFAHNTHNDTISSDFAAS